MTLAQHLENASKNICEANGCTEEEHRCESYAYIRHDMVCIDICRSDFFTGCNVPYAAIPLPWSGSEEDLQEQVAEQCEDFS